MNKKISYLGMGVWGFCLASLLARKGYHVTGWARCPQLVHHLQTQRCHPQAPGIRAPDNLTFTTRMEEALDGTSMIVESVTSAGIRPVSEQLKSIMDLRVPFVITSKGIEQHTGLLLSEIILEIFGPQASQYLGYLSGPSIAKEVLQGKPCSVVISAYHAPTLQDIHQTFHTSTFRVYPNSDIKGVALGGALKNIIAIACGISDGLNFGGNAKSSLVTRGLHEMRRFASVMGCRPETFNGLAGLGDLCATCFSSLSRNTKFGMLIAQGYSLEEAKNAIGMVVEGAYTTLSAYQLAQHHQLDIPITSGIYKVLYENLDIREGITSLLQRNPKAEYL